MRVQAVAGQAAQSHQKCVGRAVDVGQENQPRRQRLTVEVAGGVQDEEAGEVDVGQLAERHERIVGGILAGGLQQLCAGPPRGRAGSSAMTVTADCVVTMAVIADRRAVDARGAPALANWSTKLIVLSLADEDDAEIQARG